jgi:RNA polymerase sigma-70 factor (ECF subfamily)
VNTNQSPDSELLRRAQNGEATAFNQIVELHVEPVWRCARVLCGDDHEAEDLAQETFVEAWRSLHRFDGRARFSTWLYGILRHRFLKSRRKRRPVIEDDVERSGRPSREAEPLAAAVQAEEATLVLAALAVLPDEHRAVLELRFYADASLADIATLLGCPLGTVKSRLHHGLEKLRRGNHGVNLFAISGESPVSET